MPRWILPSAPGILLRSSKHSSWIEALPLCKRVLTRPSSALRLAREKSASTCSSRFMYLTIDEFLSSVSLMPLRPVECSPGCPCCVSRPRPPSCRPPSSQLSPEPLDAERGGEHSRRGQGGDGPHVVPGGPLRDVLGPAARCAGVLGVQRREAVVERDVARDRYPDGANEVERAASDHQRRRPFAGGDHGPRYEPEASCGRPEQCRHESGGDGQLVDRLHRGDAVRCRQPLERGHHERREGEEDPRVQAASEGTNQRRGVEDPAHRLSSQTPVEAASRAYTAKSLGSRSRARWTPS